MSIPGLDFKGIGISGINQQFLKDRQTISVTDVISEGPIYGLVDGAASIFLNDDRAVPLSEASSFYSQSAALATFTAGSTSVTISGAGANPIIQSAAGDKYLIVRGGHGQKSVVATNGSAGTANYAITATLTTSDGSSFFSDAMISTPVDVDTHVPARLGIVAAGGTGDGAFGEGWITKRTSNSVAEFVPGGPAGPSGLWIPYGTYSLEVDKIAKIATVSGTTITLASAWTGLSGAYRFDVTGAIVSKLDNITQTQTTNHEGVTTQFRVGTLAQTPFSGKGGEGSTSISNSPSAGGTLERSNNYGGSDAPKILIGSSSSGFGLTLSQLQEVDEARFTIAYPGGHRAMSGSGTDKFTYTRYKTMISIKKPGEGSFESFQVLKNPLTHQGNEKNAVTFVETIDLTAFRPFSDFKIQVERISNHEGGGYKSLTEQKSSWTQVTQSSLTNTTCVIKEVLTHPFTALGKVTFDTKKFTNTPTRSYHLRGLKVSIPSNYVTREQTSNNVATYNRNITSGAITTSYQDWDGAFAPEKAYTNNPAWIFYDILTNNRYGLGDFLKDTDIDKYALYRIARYCDGLVDDGKGGLEPRFTANLYFTKAADAYKVLKDIATVFRSMLYYIDGKVVPVMDAPSGPVYNFTKANVIEGKFSYEGTGSKTRINQCIVTWIDPDANYKASPLLVEDRLNIAETGTIISQSAMAMGATSEGQALRYGRWKLWTAANQREVVSFSTALNATFLIPGDIINVQDADRYATRMGGRTSNSGTTRSTTSIPLDSTTTLIANRVYQLAVVFIEPGAFTTEDVTISGVDYKKGDLIKQAFVTGSSSLQDIDTEVKASNARATNAGNPLNLQWAETTTVETKEVSTAAGDVDTLTIKTSGTNTSTGLPNTAFSAVPAAESIWVLTETSGGLTVVGSAKEYKVLAISQTAKNEFGITAVEHYDEKFAAVDEDFTTYIADTVYPPVRNTDTVPPVRDISSSTFMKVGGGNELVLQWTPPVNVGELSGIYEHLSGYEIAHTFPGIESPVLINTASQTSWSVDNVQDGTYEVAIKVVNVLQNVSVAVVASVTVSDEFDENIPRLPEGVPYTGDIDSSLEISSSGSFTITTTDYIFNHPSPYAAIIQGVSATTATHTHDCSNMAVTTKTEQADDGEFIVEHYYVMLDSSDTADRIKLLKYYKPTTGSGASFWYNTGTGNTTDGYGSNLTGTFLKEANSSKVTGSSTSFLSEIKAGDVLKLGTEEIRVSSVKDNTTLFLEIASTTAHSGVTGKIPNIRIDKRNDCIIARVYKTGANAYSRFNYAKRSAIGSVASKTARLTASQYVLPYTLAGTESTTLTFTGTATNFEEGNRTYKFYVDNVLKQTTTNTSDSHTFVLADGDEPANSAQKTIKLEIIQENVTAIDSTSIYGIKDGSNAFTVILTNEAHTIPADENGLALTYANSGTDIRVFLGSTALTYATSGANTFSVAVASDTDITVNASPSTVSTYTRRYGVASGMANSAFQASITYNVTTRDSEGTATVFTKVQSITKGNAGASAKVVNLTASKYVIPYTLADTESTTITLTATAKNTSGSKIYKFYVDNTLITATGGTQTTTGNAVTCNIPQSLEPANGAQITVRVDVTSGGTVVASDSTSIYGVKDGSDAFTVILTNEAHAIPATSAGVPRTYANSGTDIRVFLGSTALAYNTSGANTFNVTAVSGNDIDPNASPTTVSTYTRRYGIASGMLNNAFADFITYTIVARNGEGTANTFTKIQSFTKGNDGVNADALTITSNTLSGNTRTIAFSDGTSITVDNGTNGAAGAQSATVSLYNKNTSNSSAPAAFSGTFTYTFATGAVSSGTLNGWTTAVPSLAAGEYAWVRQATASAVGTTDSVPTSEFSNAVMHSGVGEDGASVTGAAGNSNAVVALYRVSTSNSSAPAAFSGTFTYTFATGVISGGTPNSWTTTIPTVPQGSYLWVRQATASANTSSDTIATSEFSAAVVAGASGEDGLTKGVKALYASSNNPTAWSAVSTTEGSNTHVNFYEYTGSFSSLSDSAVTALTFVKLIGEDGDSEGVIPVYSTNATGSSKSFSPGSREYVNFYEWSGTKPAIGDSRVTALNSFVKYIGAPGADSTVQGPVGPDGLRSIQGYLYYEKSSSPNSAPAKPGTVTYTFSNGLISGTGIGTAVNTWTNEPRTHTATSANTHWAVRYYGTEASANASTISIPTGQISSAVKSTVFTGVVTFNGGTLTDGSGSGDITPVQAAGVAAAVNANSTTIDGGKLTTGSITASQLAISNNSGGSQGIFMDGTNNRIDIRDGSALRVRIGQL